MNHTEKQARHDARAQAQCSLLIALTLLGLLTNCKEYPKATHEAVAARTDSLFQISDQPQPRLQKLHTLKSHGPVPKLTPSELAKKTRKLLASGKYQLATQHAQQLTHLKAHRFAGHFLLGRIASRQSNWKDAKNHYERSLRHAPNHLWANNNLGYVALQMGLFPIAAQALERATLHPKAKGFMFNSLGIAYLNLNKKDEASTAFSEAIRREPNNLVADRYLSSLRQEQISKEPLVSNLQPKNTLFYQPPGHSIQFSNSTKRTSRIERGGGVVP